jgi:hypothetical protein
LYQADTAFTTSALVTRFDARHRSFAVQLDGYGPYSPMALFNSSAQREIESWDSLRASRTTRVRFDAMPQPAMPVVRDENDASGEGGIVNVEL